MNRSYLRQFALLGLMIGVVFLAYYPTLNNGFVWDDDRYIEQNVQLRTLPGLERIWFDPLRAEPQYYPLTHSTFWIEYQMWGLNPLGYHLDNILLHAASAILLWRLLLRLKVPGAWAAAMIFAVHPMQVESVAWATERKNVLSGIFYFLSLWAYLNTNWGRQIWEGEQDKSSQKRWGWYALSLLLFLGAILSKSVASTLPGAILLLCWWRRGKIRRCDVWPLIPMFFLGGAMGLLTGWMEKHVVGAIGPDFDFLTSLDRVCIAGRAFWFYLGKLLWPLRLSFIYSHWEVDVANSPRLLLYPLLALALGVACWIFRRRIGRGPLVAVLFFGGTLFPALGFVNVFPMRYSYVADHFQYLACIGPIVLIVAGIARYLNRPAAVFATMVVIVPLCAASNLRTRIYLDRKTLWAETVAANPGSAMAHNNYGAALRDDGQIEAAKAQFRYTILFNPRAADWVGLGQCFAMQGNFAVARDMYLRELEATPDSSEPVLHRLRAGVEFQLGTAYQGLARQAKETAAAHQYRTEAIKAYQTAIADYPEYEDPRTNLAVVLIQERDFAGAIEQCQTVLKQNPESTRAHSDLGLAYATQRKLDEAIAQYKAVLGIDPGNADAMASIGAILAQKGDLDAGIAMLDSALKIDPNNMLAQQNLMAAMRKKAQSP